MQTKALEKLMFSFLLFSQTNSTGGMMMMMGQDETKSAEEKLEKVMGLKRQFL